MVSARLACVTTGYQRSALRELRGRVFSRKRELNYSRGFLGFRGRLQQTETCSEKFLDRMGNISRTWGRFLTCQTVCNPAPSSESSALAANTVAQHRRPIASPNSVVRLHLESLSLPMSFRRRLQSELAHCHERWFHLRRCGKAHESLEIPKTCTAKRRPDSVP